MAQKAAVALPQCPREYRSLSHEQMRRVLHELRTTNPVRQPLLVHYCGMELLKHASRSLGDEVWTIYEQVLVASLDCHHMADAKHCWQQLADRFSKDSRRVQRLHGLILEAEGKYTEADECYKAILEETNNCDKQAHKRRVAVAKARGNRAAAISTLEEYIALYQVDEEAYHELGDLHLGEGDYWKACHCFEEVLLNDPQNYMYVRKYAEALYSIGEKQATLEARKYFANSIRLHDSVRNLRAYYGLWITCLMLATSHGLRDNVENKDLFNWVVAKLRALYAAHAMGAAPRVTLMLAKNNLDASA